MTRAQSSGGKLRLFPRPGACDQWIMPSITRNKVPGIFWIIPEYSRLEKSLRHRGWAETDSMISVCSVTLVCVCTALPTQHRVKVTSLARDTGTLSLCQQTRALSGDLLSPHTRVLYFKHFTSSIHIHALIAKRTKVNKRNSLQKHGWFSRKESGIHETRFKVLRNESLIHVMPGKKGREGILKDYCMRWDAAEPPVESKHLEISASLSRVWRHEWSQELFVVYPITSQPIRGRYLLTLTNEKSE